MRRLFCFCLVLVVFSAFGLARAQQAPGTLLGPTQVDPVLGQNIAATAAGLSMAYVGDCGAATPDEGQVCSQVYLQDNGSLVVLLADGTNAPLAMLQATQQSDGSWVITPVTTPAAPALLTPVPPPPTAITTPAPGPTYIFDDGVSADDRDTIHSGIDIGRRILGEAGSFRVYAFSDINQLLTAYAKEVCGGCPLDAGTRDRWTNAGEGETGFGWIFLYTGSAGWRTAPPPMALRAFRIKVVVHEYMHVVQNAGYGRSIATSCAGCPYAAGPVWLIEGGAEYAAYKASDAAGVLAYADGRALALTGSYQVTLPLQALETWQQPQDSHQESAPYTLGLLAVEYLSGIGGPDSLLHFWSVSAASPRWQDAFQTTFGLSVDDFYSRFASYRQTQLAPPPPSLAFVGIAQPGSVTGFPPGGTIYTFRLTGIVGQLSNTALRVLSSSGAVVSTSWGRQATEQLVVYLSPNTPAGTYTAVVTMPSGQTLQASFSHAGG